MLPSCLLHKKKEKTEHLLSWQKHYGALIFVQARAFFLLACLPIFRFSTKPLAICWFTRLPALDGRSFAGALVNIISETYIFGWWAPIWGSITCRSSFTTSWVDAVRTVFNGIGIFDQGFFRCWNSTPSPSILPDRRKLGSSSSTTNSTT